MVDFQPLSLSPAACVLNYGQGLFEGMKARRTPDGRITLFRPEMNARRAAEGAKRLVMPEISESMFIEAVKKVAEENKRWVPPHGKGELYLRPILFGSSARLGVSPAEEYMFVVFAVPVGPYFKGGMTPISLRVSQNHHHRQLRLHLLSNHRNPQLPVYDLRLGQLLAPLSRLCLLHNQLNG